MNVNRLVLLLAFGVGLSIATAGFGADDLAAQKRTDVITRKGQPLTLVGQPAEVGVEAPDFTLQDRTAQPVSLSDFAGKVRIISVFPSIDTTICPIQVRTFNQEAAQLDNVQIMAVSVDLPFALDRFCAAEGIDNLVVLSDHKDTDFGLKYGFLIDEMRLLARGTVIVDQQGVVRYVEYVSPMETEPDYEKAIAVAKKLLSEV